MELHPADIIIFLIACSVYVNNYIFDLFVFVVKMGVHVCMKNEYCITIK